MKKLLPGTLTETSGLRRLLAGCLVIAAILGAAGCTKKAAKETLNGNFISDGNKVSNGNSISAGREILDRSGRTVVIKGPINRIVSAAPSNTEIIVDLGLADKLVAVDRYSTDIAESPYTLSNESPFGLSRGLPAGLMRIDFAYPDAEAILGLEPDLIIANGHNPTVSGDDPFRLIKEMGIPVAYISMSRSINDIYEDIAFVADLLGVKERGQVLISSMKARVEELAQKTARANVKRSVYIEISAAPEIFTFGKDSYISDMISVIGGRNIFGNDNWVLSPSVEAIIERNPDVILTCVDYLEDPIGEIKSRDGFNHINAVINNRICQIDTNSLVRPSARIVLALNQMARAVYPEMYE